MKHVDQLTRFSRPLKSITTHRSIQLYLLFSAQCYGTSSLLFPTLVLTNNRVILQCDKFGNYLVYWTLPCGDFCRDAEESLSALRFTQKIPFISALFLKPARDKLRWCLFTESGSIFVPVQLDTARPLAGSSSPKIVLVLPA